MSDPNNNHAPGPDSPAPDNVSSADAAPVHPPMADAAGQPDAPDCPETPADPTAPAGAGGEPGADDSGAAPDTARVAELEAALAEEKERYLRAMAEMENVRRRAAEDVSKAHKFSIESFAEALIPVKDSLEMALKVETPTVESLNEGVEATLRQLSSAFERNQLIELDPLGQKFDPNHHQAISTMPASAANPPVEPNHVATVLQKGYLINDRVLRPALVVVAEA